MQLLLVLFLAKEQACFQAKYGTAVHLETFVKPTAEHFAFTK